MMRKREGTQNESDTKRICMEDWDFFDDDDVNYMIFSYLGEDSKFCFSLTSRKNNQSVCDYIKRDELYRDKTKPLSHASENDVEWSPPLGLRRAHILYDAVREGHLDVLKWLALDQKVRVDLICGPTFARYPVFEPFTYYQHLDSYWETGISGNGKSFKRVFRFGESLRSIYVAARYGKEDIVRYFSGKRLNLFQIREYPNRIDEDLIIGGYRTSETFRGMYLDMFSVQHIVQLAPVEEVEHLVRSRPGFLEKISLKDLIVRGDVKLFDYIEPLMTRFDYEKRPIIYGALLSGNLKMIERAIEKDKDRYASSTLSPQQIREMYCGDEMVRVGIETITCCKETTEDIIDRLVMGRREDYIRYMIELAGELKRASE